jgi:hypothetical protein
MIRSLLLLPLEPLQLLPLLVDRELRGEDVTLLINEVKKPFARLGRVG